MKRIDCSNELWEYVSGELSGEFSLEIEGHLSSCLSCAKELESIKEIRNSLQSTAGLDIDGAKSRVLARALSGAAHVGAEDRPQFFRAKSFKWAAPFGVAAALIISLFISLWPVSTSALTVDDLVGWHIRCLKDDLHKNYTCKTQVELDKKMLQSLGVKSHPFNMNHHKFVQGDICKIKGSLAAHALFRMDDEKLVSHFHVNDLYGQIKNRDGLRKINEHMYHFSIKDHQILIGELSPGNFEVYISKTDFKSLMTFVEEKKS